MDSCSPKNPIEENNERKIAHIKTRKCVGNLCHQEIPLRKLLIVHFVIMHKSSTFYSYEISVK